jgi:hypothetical protein
MKRSYKILLGVSIVLFIAVAVVFAITLINMRPIETRFANVTVTDDKGGFELNKGSQDLTFGKVKAPGASTRMINFTNGFEFPVILRMNAKGTIAPLLSLDDVRFEAGETKTITISAVTTKETELGYYSGYVNFRLLAAK